MRPIVNMSEEDRATDTGNTHKNLVKIALAVPDIFSRTDRQTDRPTDRQAYSSQYFATVPAVEVITVETSLSITNGFAKQQHPVYVT